MIYKMGCCSSRERDNEAALREDVRNALLGNFSEPSRYVAPVIKQPQYYNV